ncbi:MAG: hypothetical protein ACC653_13040 [Gammaproteobacteria bacterium]
MLFRYQIKARLVLVLSSCLLAVMTITPLHAEIDELYKLSIGTSLANFNSKININSVDGSNGNGTDLEDDMGFDSTVNSLWLSGTYRVGDNHRLRLTYLPIRRTAFKLTEKDFNVNNTTIKAGATIAWDSSINIFDFSYIYSVYRKPNLEVGVSFGLYWLSSENKLLTSGNIIVDGDTTPVFKSDYRVKLKFEAPLPLIGVKADYEITPNWRTHGSLRYLDLTIDNITGKIMSADFGTEYYFTRSWGVGTSLAYFSLNVDRSGVVFKNAIEWSHNELLLYGVFKY